MTNVKLFELLGISSKSPGVNSVENVQLVPGSFTINWLLRKKEECRFVCCWVSFVADNSQVKPYLAMKCRLARFKPEQAEFNQANTAKFLRIAWCAMFLSSDLNRRLASPLLCSCHPAEMPSIQQGCRTSWMEWLVAMEQSPMHLVSLWIIRGTSGRQEWWQWSFLLSAVVPTMLFLL